MAYVPLSPTTSTSYQLSASYIYYSLLMTELYSLRFVILMTDTWRIKCCIIIIIFFVLHSVIFSFPGN